jgi:hypothetical protein
MNTLLMQRDGIDLHHTLFASETSRLALRFYHPKKVSCGVVISAASLGSALSMVSELRWYIRRYVREVLFELKKGVYCTQALAQDVYYERAVVLDDVWKFRRLYGFKNGQLISAVVMTPGSAVGEYHQEIIAVDAVIEVWCREDEVEDIALEDSGPVDEPGGAADEMDT